MDLSTLVPIERVVDVLHPKTVEPTGLKLTLAHDSDPRVIDATRKVFEEARTKGDVDPERGRRLTMAHVVGWEWTGEVNFRGEAPAFSTEALADVCKVPPVAAAIFRAVNDDAGFYKG